jgi:hypothetical protein
VTGRGISGAWVARRPLVGSTPMRSPQSWLTASLLLGLTVGCQRHDDPTTRPLPSAAPSAAVTAVTGLSPADRLAAATALCAARAPCEPAQARALVAAADDERERAALRKAASEALFARTEAWMKERLKPATLSTTGAQGRTVRISSEHCDGFLIERFVDSTEGRTAAALGFDRIQCQHGGVSLEAALTE